MVHLLLNRGENTDMRRYIFFLILIILFSTTCPLWSSDLKVEGMPDPYPWSVELKVRNYIKSHTSYEFGNPYPPNQSPLSRLEFPMDSWWAGAEARRSFNNRVSVGIEVLRNVTRETDGLFKDSDWDDDSNVNRKTIYSESSARMEPSYSVRGDVDLKISDWLGLPARWDIRPVAGFRWQRLTFMTHDGSQSEADVGQTALPGDGIHFEQIYWQAFAGAKFACNLGRPFKLKRLSVVSQVDWAYVEARNEDHHLLRRGNRFTYEKTYGDAWHVMLGLRAGLTERVNLGFELDFTQIKTTGTHRLESSFGNIDYSFDRGVQVYSEQFSATMSLQYIF